MRYHRTGPYGWQTGLRGLHEFCLLKDSGRKEGEWYETEHGVGVHL